MQQVAFTPHKHTSFYLIFLSKHWLISVKHQVSIIKEDAILTIFTQTFEQHMDWPKIYSKFYPSLLARDKILISANPC
jgi:hypothetical protein